MAQSHSQQSSGWYPSYSNAASKITLCPGGPPSGPYRGSVSTLPPSGVAVIPPLIRTSILQPPRSLVATTHGVHSFPESSASSICRHKAELELNGDLNAMVRDWTKEEWECNRRLVNFKWSQSGSTITTHFQPITARDRLPTSICISCIYWEERKECFVTSFDTLYLLEQLLVARFTVDEKNRIRRNLEGFYPLTVSKGNANSEAFFKMIMAFPKPKPRNIARDVKVFCWKDLANALRKVVGKYVSAAPPSRMTAFREDSDHQQSAGPLLKPPPLSAPPLLAPDSTTGHAIDGSTRVLSPPTLRTLPCPERALTCVHVVMARPSRLEANASSVQHTRSDEGGHGSERETMIGNKLTE